MAMVSELRELVNPSKSCQKIPNELVASLEFRFWPKTLALPQSLSLLGGNDMALGHKSSNTGGTTYHPAFLVMELTQATTW
jgi:hypothetical protein